MIELKQTETFRMWRLNLTDDRLLAKIAVRLNRLASGNAGDVRPVGQGVSEMRIDYGAGYRIYFKRRGNTVVILLCGGDKSTQVKDIKTARKLAEEGNLEDA